MDTELQSSEKQKQYYAEYDGSKLFKAAVESV